MALADAFMNDGYLVAFAISDETLKRIPELSNKPYEIVKGFGISFESDISLFKKSWDNCEILILDNYDIGIDYEKELKDFASKRLVIDDLALRNHDCEFLCDQTFNRSPFEYENLTPKNCTLLCSSQYALLRYDFALARHKIKPVNNEYKLNNILISVGMSDIGNLMPLIVSGISQSKFNGELNIVFGSNAKQLKSLEIQINNKIPNAKIHYHISSEKMAFLMQKSNLIIGAAGVSSYERGALGIPALVIKLAANQSDNIKQLKKTGAISYLGDIASLDADKICNKINELMNDKNKLISMQNAALKLADARGAQRVVMAMKPEKSYDDKDVLFRPTKMEDAKILHEWQIQPLTRKFARNPEVPPFDEHKKWLENKLNEATCLFNIVIYDGKPAGMVRLDKATSLFNNDEAYEVSILISSDFHRLGLATSALRLARRLTPNAEIQAVILAENQASHELFLNAGYKKYKNYYCQIPA